MTDTTGGNLDKVPQRGRPTDYTPEEDAIILRHRDTETVQRLLREAGLPERTAPAIWSRRKYLNEGAPTGADTSMLEQDDEVTVLLARQKRLRQHIISHAEALAALEAELNNVTERLHDLIDCPVQR